MKNNILSKILFTQLLYFLFFGLLSVNVFCISETETNKFVHYLDAGELESAEQLITQFTELGEDNYPELNYLRSLWYFYQGDYRTAAVEIEKAITSEPSRTEWQNNLRYFQQLTDQSAEFTEITTTHFRIRYKPEDEILKFYLPEVLEKIYTQLGAEFQFYPPEKVLVEIHSTRDEFLLFSTLTQKDVDNSGAIAICKFNRLMILSPRCAALGYRWMDTLAHEYVHYLINRITQFHCPLWLHEGIARFYDTIWRSSESLYFTPGYSTVLHTGVKENKLVSFQRMEPSLVKLNGQDEVNLAFAQVANTVDYLRTVYGKDTVKKLLTNLKVYDTTDLAFKSVFSTNSAGIESGWQTWLVQTSSVSYPGARVNKFYWSDQPPDEIEVFVGTDVRGHLRFGDKLRIRGLYESALDQYTRALEKEPYNPVILNKCARTYLSLGKRDLAKIHLEKAVSYDTNYPTCYLTLADLCLSEQKIDDACRYYNEYIAINPYNPEIHKKVGLCYFLLDQDELAVQEWTVTLKLTPRDIQTRGWLLADGGGKSDELTGIKSEYKKKENINFVNWLNYVFRLP